MDLQQVVARGFLVLHHLDRRVERLGRVGAEADAGGEDGRPDDRALRDRVT